MATSATVGPGGGLVGPDGGQVGPAGGAKTVILPLLESTRALYAPTVTPVQVVVLPLLTSTSALYAPAISGTFIRVSQDAIEVIVKPDTAAIRVSQDAIEVLRRTGPDPSNQIVICG